MRKTSFFAAFLLLLAFGRPGIVQAQFFKNLVNTVKQTAQGRANNKADQATNKSLDKVDTSGNSFLGAFSRSSSSNPGDTSAANMTMKALGLVVGGGGVSAADSAAAFEAFRSASGGSGMFYQYETKMTSKKDPPVDDTTCTWFTNNGGDGTSDTGHEEQDHFDRPCRPAEVQPSALCGQQNLWAHGDRYFPDQRY
jgi:hypothetical protein